MLLAIDAGNTRTALGLFQGRKLVGSWRVSTERGRTADEHALLIGRLLGRKRARVKSIAIASVVPPLEETLQECGRKLGARDVFVLDHESPLGFRVGYHPPADVGADRLANVAAAVEKYGAPVVIADFGTAVTLDVLDRKRVYLGGIIAPGIELAAESLFRRTARLPQVRLGAPRAAIGRSTLESLRSGLVLGCAALVDGLLERVFSELGGRARVIGTGGAAGIVAPLTRHIRQVDPDLTLEGIRLVAERAGYRKGGRRRGRSTRAAPSLEGDNRPEESGGERASWRRDSV